MKETTKKQAADSTVEALMYELRTLGLGATAGDNCMRRLDDLSRSQLVEVITRLVKLRGKYPAITNGLLRYLHRRMQEK